MIKTLPVAALVLLFWGTTVLIAAAFGPGAGLFFVLGPVFLLGAGFLIEKMRG